MLLAAPLIAGCLQTSSSSDTIRICTAAGCSDQPKSTATFRPADEGEPTFRDPVRYDGEAVAALRQGAAAGDRDAAYKLALAHRFGLGGLKENAAEAATLWDQWASRGDAWSAYRLAMLYEEGVGVRNDPNRAFSLLLAAQRKGHALAAFAVGAARLKTDFGPPDPAEAARSFRMAADAGVPDAQYNLALLTFRGEGVKQDSYRALQMMRKAGEHGVVEAQLSLGRLYLTGLEEMGIDPQESQKWLRMAAAGGNEEAAELLVEVDALRANQQAYQARHPYWWNRTYYYWWHAPYYYAYFPARYHWLYYY